MKTVIKILLGVAIIFLGYICVMSIVTPIEFDKERAVREAAVVQKLIQIRAAQLEFREQNGRYASSMDSLILFVKTAKKKEVMKEGALTEAQLEAGLTEQKAVRIVASGNQREIAKNGLEKFRRDTIFIDMIDNLYRDIYTVATVDQLAVIPYSENMRFEVSVNNDYVNVSGIKIPLFEVRAPYDTFLQGLDKQQVVNVKSVARGLEKYEGLKVGSIEEPNNNAGNWE